MHLLHIHGIFFSSLNSILIIPIIEKQNILLLLHIFDRLQTKTIAQVKLFY